MGKELKKVSYKGKHAEMCRLISEGKSEDALRILYAFFKSEENTDSYSIELLTIVRELLEGSSEALDRIRIRMKRSGDKVMMNIAQFMHAFAMGGYADAAESLSDKCFSELPRLVKSMHEYAEEEGLSPASEMAGLRIHEAVRIWELYLNSVDEDKSAEIDELVSKNLEMSRIFLNAKDNILSVDMMRQAKRLAKSGKKQDALALYTDIVRQYGHVVDDIEGADDFKREWYEMLDAVSVAYRALSEAGQGDYSEIIRRIDDILSEDDD